MKFADQPRQIWRRGNSYNGPEAQKNTRIPFGHPEGFIEAFANIYAAVTEAVRDHLKADFKPGGYDFPTVDDGVEGLAFIEATVESSEHNAAWTKLER